jgi:hypothetical protein
MNTTDRLLPIFTWPEMRKSPTGLRIRAHNGHCATFIRPAKTDGAIVHWDGDFRATTLGQPTWVSSEAFPDGIDGHVCFVGAARHATPIRIKAWDLIGFDSTAESMSDPDIQKAIGPGLVDVRICGGRAHYEAVIYNGANEKVKLARLETSALGLYQVSRYVDPDIELELIEVSR